jgi:hypothetical protein
MTWKLEILTIFLVGANMENILEINLAEKPKISYKTPLQAVEASKKDNRSYLFLFVSLLKL